MALSAARNTDSSGPLGRQHSLKQAGSTTIYKGAIVMIDAGYAKPGATAASKVAAGRAAETSANTGADGAVSVKVEEGVFSFTNSTGDALAQADVGALCYIEDDQTVCKTSTSKTVAGRFIGFDDNSQCLVKMGIGQG